LGWLGRLRGEDEEVLDPFERIEREIDKGRGIPGSDQVRIDRGKLLELIDAELIPLASDEPGGAVAELRRLVAEARPIPLTKEHRISRDDAKALLAEARAEG
jgi:hypothetical protein